MGVNTITLRVPREAREQDGKRQKNYPQIDYREASLFKESYAYDATVSLSANARFTAVVRSGDRKTNPNVRVIGGDENYVEAGGYLFSAGRNFSPNELNEGANVAILGHDIVSKLNLSPEQAIDRIMNIGDLKYRVVGVLESKGATLGFNNDLQAIVPLRHVKYKLSDAGTRYMVSITTEHPEDLSRASDAAIGTMRVIRGDRIGADSSFEVVSSDGTATRIIDSLSFLDLAAKFIAIITLLGAAIGLMNIMLVSVTERTREIGVRKAIGASSSSIRWQFLTEAIAIGQIGGLMGTVLGIAVGNLIAYSLGADFIIPWKWIIGAVIICLFVSVLSGFYPANKAAKMDPIDSLRFE